MDKAKEDQRIDVMDSCTEHVILYAKNWYGKTGRKNHVVEDLREILGLVTGMSTLNENHFTKGDVRRCLVNAWAECSPVMSEMERSTAMLQMLDWGWSCDSTPEEVICGKLSILSPSKVKFVEGKTVDEKRMMDIRFGDKR